MKRLLVAFGGGSKYVLILALWLFSSPVQAENLGFGDLIKSITVDVVKEIANEISGQQNKDQTETGNAENIVRESHSGQGNPQNSSRAAIANELESNPSSAAAVQQMLNDLGFDAGAVDGQPGPQTRKAIQAFQISRGFPPSNQLTETQLAALQSEHQLVTGKSPTSDLTAGQSATSSLTAEQIYDAQLYLRHLGYDPGTPDGKWGSRSQNALNEFRASRELYSSGSLTSADLSSLQSSVHGASAPNTVSRSSADTSPSRASGQDHESLLKDSGRNEIARSDGSALKHAADYGLSIVNGAVDSSVFDEATARFGFHEWFARDYDWFKEHYRFMEVAKIMMTDDEKKQFFGVEQDWDYDDEGYRNFYGVYGEDPDADLEERASWIFDNEFARRAARQTALEEFYPKWLATAPVWPLSTFSVELETLGEYDFDTQQFPLKLRDSENYRAVASIGTRYHRGKGKHWMASIDQINLNAADGFGIAVPENEAQSFIEALDDRRVYIAWWGELDYRDSVDKALVDAFYENERDEHFSSFNGFGRGKLLRAAIFADKQLTQVLAELDPASLLVQPIGEPIEETPQAPQLSSAEKLMQNLSPDDALGKLLNLKTPDAESLIVTAARIAEGEDAVLSLAESYYEVKKANEFDRGYVLTEISNRLTNLKTLEDFWLLSDNRFGRYDLEAGTFPFLEPLVDKELSHDEIDLRLAFYDAINPFKPLSVEREIARQIADTDRQVSVAMRIVPIAADIKFDSDYEEYELTLVMQPIEVIFYRLLRLGSNGTFIPVEESWAGDIDLEAGRERLIEGLAAQTVQVQVLGRRDFSSDAAQARKWHSEDFSDFSKAQPYLNPHLLDLFAVREKGVEVLDGSILAAMSAAHIFHNAQSGGPSFFAEGSDSPDSSDVLAASEEFEQWIAAKTANLPKSFSIFWQMDRPGFNAGCEFYPFHNIEAVTGGDGSTRLSNELGLPERRNEPERRSTNQYPDHAYFIHNGSFAINGRPIEGSEGSEGRECVYDDWYGTVTIDRLPFIGESTENFWEFKRTGYFRNVVVPTSVEVRPREDKGPPSVHIFGTTVQTEIFESETAIRDYLPAMAISVNEVEKALAINIESEESVTREISAAPVTQNAESIAMSSDRTAEANESGETEPQSSETEWLPDDLLESLAPKWPAALENTDLVKSEWDILNLRLGMEASEARSVLQERKPDFVFEAVNGRLGDVLGYLRAYVFNGGNDIVALFSYSPDGAVLAVSRLVSHDSARLPFNKVAKALVNKYGPPINNQFNDVWMGWSSAESQTCTAESAAVQVNTTYNLEFQPVDGTQSADPSLAGKLESIMSLHLAQGAPILDSVAECQEVLMYLAEDLAAMGMGEGSHFGTMLTDFRNLKAVDTKLNPENYSESETLNIEF